jgi:hypothetical protein
MNDYTLAREFENYKFIHKSSIVLGSLLKYYNDIASTGVTIPDFMASESPEDRAKQHYFELLADKNKFNETYEMCWERYKEVLP